MYESPFIEAFFAHVLGFVVVIVVSIALGIISGAISQDANPGWYIIGALVLCALIGYAASFFFGLLALFLMGFCAAVLYFLSALITSSTA
jgi:hypothetical protein